MPEPKRSAGGRLVVLGGSSPFTAALIDALAPGWSRLGIEKLVLQGRNSDNLALLRRYADHRLGEGVTVSDTRLPAALVDATIVLQQNRYGGLEGRARDEDLALEFGICPDETLGPSALSTILRTRNEIAALGETLAAICPDAWVLNLTNPLSVTTSLLAGAGVPRCVGLCELPLVTARRAAAYLQVPWNEIEWSYRGLNHRGFVVKLARGGADLIGELARRLDAPFEGVGSAEIDELQAIPTKYFRLLRGGHRPRGGRAGEVNELRDLLLDELRERIDRSPPGLARRYMEWYPASVVPMVAALTRQAPSRQVVNVPGEDGLTRELHARVGAHRVETLEPPPVRPETAAWLDRFERHERALLEVVRRPGPDSLRRALAEDPLVDPDSVEPIVRRMTRARYW